MTDTLLMIGTQEGAVAGPVRRPGVVAIDGPHFLMNEVVSWPSTPAAGRLGCSRAR